MAHSCPTCGQACYCDGEDTWWDEEEDCIHDCDPRDLENSVSDEDC
jgi:hypothetical protein